MSQQTLPYAEFWKNYLQEHAKPGCRGLHYLGITSALVMVAFFMGTGREVFAVLSLVTGYGAAWIGHLVFDKKTPSGWRHPIWSLLSDFRLYFLWMAGKLDPHLRDAGVSKSEPRAETQLAHS